VSTKNSIEKYDVSTAEAKPIAIQLGAAIMAREGAILGKEWELLKTSKNLLAALYEEYGARTERPPDSVGD
jgi:hypothetical protein